MTINGVDLDNQQIDIETKAIMNQRVAKSTRGVYKISNIAFILCLFYYHNKYPILLQPTLYDMKMTKNLEDISRMKTPGKRSKSRHVISDV